MSQDEGHFGAPGTRKHSLESGRSGCLAVQATYVVNIECLHIPRMYLSVSLRQDSTYLPICGFVHFVIYHLPIYQHIGACWPIRLKTPL